MMRTARVWLILTLVVILCSAAQAAWGSPFSTVSRDHWAYKDIEYLRSKGIIPGPEEGPEDHWHFADRGEAAAALARTLEVFDASTATEEEKSNLKRILAFFARDLEAAGVIFPKDDPLAASAGTEDIQPSRFETAGLLARTLETVDREKIDKADLERVDRLVDEYREELNLWAPDVEGLEERVATIEEGVGGWHLSGTLRFDANYYRAGAVGSEGYGIYTDDPGQDSDTRFSRMWLNILKRVDDKVSFFSRLEMDSDSEENGLFVDQAYILADFPGNWGSYIGRWYFDWEADDSLYLGEEPIFTHRVMNGFLVRHDLPMGHFEAYASRPEKETGAEQGYEFGARYKMHLSERLRFSLNAIERQPDEGFDKQILWTAAGLDLNPFWTVRGAIYRQDTGTDTPYAFQAILQGKQTERALTSFWLEFMSFDQGFEFWNSAYQDYGTFMGWNDGEGGHSTTPVGDVYDNILFIRLDQQWDEKISSFQRYVLALHRYDGENALNFTVGLKYRYTPNIAFILVYDKVEEAFDEGLDDHLIQLRTEVWF